MLVSLSAMHNLYKDFLVGMKLSSLFLTLSSKLGQILYFGIFYTWKKTWFLLDNLMQKLKTLCKSCILAIWRTENLKRRKNDSLEAQATSKIKILNFEKLYLFIYFAYLFIYLFIWLVQTDYFRYSMNCHFA